MCRRSRYRHHGGPMLINRLSAERLRRLLAGRIGIYCSSSLPPPSPLLTQSAPFYIHSCCTSTHRQHRSLFQLHDPFTWRRAKAAISTPCGSRRGSHGRQPASPSGCRGGPTSAPSTLSHRTASHRVARYVSRCSGSVPTPVVEERTTHPSSLADREKHARTAARARRTCPPDMR